MLSNKLRRIYNSSLKNLSAVYYSNEKLFPRTNTTYETIPAEMRSKIIYSSYLENLEYSRSYMQKKIREEQNAKTERISKLNRSKIRPFSVALKKVADIEQNKSTENEYRDLLSTENIAEEEDFPYKWMEDYEFYEEPTNRDGATNSVHGTSDPSIPSSEISCNGCGSKLHCQNPSLPGYIPTEIFVGRTDNELKQIQCQRCHFLKKYNIALDVAVPPETYIETLSTIKDKFALVILIVDLLDFPCSIWPNMPEIIGDKRKMFVVGNKVDLLPRDSPSYLNYIKKCLKDEITKFGFNSSNIKNISLISAKTGYGIEELITQLHKIWAYRGDVYLVGCTNVGKSSLFNALLKSDYCKVEASDLINKATTCPWPGTTLNMIKFPILRPSAIRIYHRYRRLFSERSKRTAEQILLKEAMKEGNISEATLSGSVGRTFVGREETNDSFATSSGTNPIVNIDERRKEYINSRWCYDTPGIIQPGQIQHLLTSEELMFVQPKCMIAPRALRLDPGMSIFLGGLARLDFLDADIDINSIRIFIYSSHDLPLLITSTLSAAEIYKKYLGTKIFGIPFGESIRLDNWPGLKQNEKNIMIYGENETGTSCDIIFSSVGWIGIKIPYNRRCSFMAWTPYGKEVYIRNPALIPLGERLIGKRIRGSLAYRLDKPFTQKKSKIKY